MKKLTLLSITLLTAGNACAMDVKAAQQPLTPRTARIIKALREHNDPANATVLGSIPEAPSIEGQVSILCERHISSAITADQFTVLHDNLKDGIPITTEEERLLPKLQDSAADQTKKTFLEHMRAATAYYYKTEIEKATQTKDGLIASAGVIIKKLQDKLILPTEKDRLNRDHMAVQTEMLKFNTQIRTLIEIAKEADAEYNALMMPGITLSNDDK